jgi:hypothetical protein
MAHAILSPSSASRWLTCTPSARLEQQYPDRAGVAAEEGTLAHTLSELLLSFHLMRVSHESFRTALAVIELNKLYDSSMAEYCGQYVTFVLEMLSEAQAHTPDALIFLEQKLNLTDYVPEGFGTGDVVIIANGTLHIIDLKYGKGVQVSAINNKQMMLYALGALREFDFLYAIDTVRMTIHQPRIDNYSSFEMPVKELKAWAAADLAPRAALAFEGKGEFVPGEHCRFCKAAAVCKANADENLKLAKYDFSEGTLLSAVEVADILNRVDRFTKWLTAVEDYALDQAVNHDVHWPGYKLVEGRSVRTFTDADKIAMVLNKAGWHENKIFNKKLLGIGDMEKLLTKERFNKLLGDYIVKPPGKPTLVPETDKRPEYNSAAGAAADFATV